MTRLLRAFALTSSENRRRRVEGRLRARNRYRRNARPLADRSARGFARNDGVSEC